MTCAEITDMLTDFVMGELPADLNEVVNQHLQSCVACRRKHQALREIIGELRQMVQQIEPPEYFNKQLEQALVAEIGATVQKNKWRFPKFIVPIVATFLIMAVGWGMWGNQTDNKNKPINDQKPAAVVLDSPEQPDKETEVQDVQLYQQHRAESAPREVKKTDDATADVAGDGSGPKLETELQPVAPQNTAESSGSPEIKSAELLRANVAEQEQCFTAAQGQAIILDNVQQVNIKAIDGDDQEQVLTTADNLQVITLIVEGINSALPSEETVIDKSDTTHIITIQLDNGDYYELNYCLPKNIGFGEGLLNSAVFRPGESLSLALQDL